METSYIQSDNQHLSFDQAKIMAEREALVLLEDPMLLSWLDRPNGRHYPVTECSNELPAWQVYAETRGAQLKVDVNKGEFVFIYR